MATSADTPLQRHSRLHPSPRYVALLQQYQTMHDEGDVRRNIPPEKIFSGTSLLHQIERIRTLIRATGSRTILDYGSGKGVAYTHTLHARDGNSWNSVVEYWGIDEVCCYDPAIPEFSMLPERQFDGVVCTDVLEHCPAEDVTWIIEELFASTAKFVYANVACYPAQKELPNGENAHCTVRPPQWWKSVILPIACARPSLKFEFCLTSPQPDDPNSRLEERFGNFQKGT